MTYPITGIGDGLGPAEGQVPVRRELDEWWFAAEKGDKIALLQRSLFAYALTNFQNMDPNDQLSYFGVAGIHGLPLKSWDTTEPKRGIYCVHGTPLFPTWHRPYMLLYEQRIYETMLELIPKTFANEDQAEMLQAAHQWRLPFWDWAEKKPDWSDPTNPRKFGPNVPFIFTQSSVEVKTKTGSGRIPNPLWRFTIPGGKTFADLKVSYSVDSDDNTGLVTFDPCKATSKHPSTHQEDNKDYTSAWIDGDQQNWQAITGQLRGAASVLSNTLPEAVYRLFTDSFAKEWNAFATSRWTKDQPPRTYASLESLHGSIHVFTGGYGAMSEVPVAGFDPVFWMHHCNIDRLFAIWQDLYPDSYVPTTTRQYRDPDSGRTWKVTVSVTDPLTPFHIDTNGGNWDSVKCRDTTQLGYTYPELEKWLPDFNQGGSFDRAKYVAAIRSKIELKYSTTGKSTLQLPQFQELAVSHIKSLSAANLAVENFPPTLVQKAGATLPTKPPTQAPVVLKGTDEHWAEKDYVVNVVYERFALGGHPYSIRIFLGDVPDDGPPFRFAYTPTEVSLVYNFSSPPAGRGLDEDGCANCRMQQEFGGLESGQVILTDYLIEHITREWTARGLTLSSLRREDVVEFLRTNLHWVVSDEHDRTIPNGDLPGLKVSVAMGHATHFRDASTPSRYENYEVLYEVTQGRDGGANPGDL